MRKITLPILLLLLMAGPLYAQPDGFQRERRGEGVSPKDALENKTPPALQVSGWMNTDGGALKLEDLKGKVIILDFWGIG